MNVSTDRNIFSSSGSEKIPLWVKRVNRDDGFSMVNQMSFKKYFKTNRTTTLIKSNSRTKRFFFLFGYEMFVYLDDFDWNIFFQWNF